jgi:hypothetical protein
MRKKAVYILSYILLEQNARRELRLLYPPIGLFSDRTLNAPFSLLANAYV